MSSFAAGKVDVTIKVMDAANKEIACFKAAPVLQ
jgi:hypothetical protein